MVIRKRHVLCKPEDGGEGSSAGAGAPSPAPAPAGAPAPSAAPSPAPAAGGGAPAPAAGGASGAPAPSPAAAAPADGAKKGAEGTPAYWPADWRETVSKEDAKVLSRLQRYASPEAALQALISAQNKISSGELKPVLQKNATAEEVKAWREAHGIPEGADKYDLKGFNTESMDKELLGVILESAHGSNQSNEQLRATLSAWGKIQQTVQEKQAERDTQLQQDGEEALRAEWGGEFRQNINIIHGLLDSTADKALKEQIFGGRLADGTPIASSPAFLKLLASLALIHNPAGVVVPGAESNPLQGVEDEITKIESDMRKDRGSYNKDEKKQARYRELLDAREKLKPRAKV